MNEFVGLISGKNAVATNSDELSWLCFIILEQGLILENKAVIKIFMGVIYLVYIYIYIPTKNIS